MKINARGKQDSLFITTRKITSKRLNSVVGNFYITPQTNVGSIKSVNISVKKTVFIFHSHLT
uniref:Uncharacterized protein n=1 Tax=Anguilla anguilla TaxID=7936 RepID=A0A0E9S0V3_ANGAN